MTDCDDGAMRDLLPDLASGRLAGDGRARVLEHVAGCAACTAELSLIRDLQATFGRGGAVESARVAAGVIAATRRTGRVRVESGTGERPQSGGWMRTTAWLAAAAVILAVGVGSLVTNERDPGAVTIGDVARSAPAAAGPGEPQAGSDSRAAAATPPLPDPAPAVVELDAALALASDAELEALLDALPDLDVLPAAEPVEITTGLTITGGDE